MVKRYIVLCYLHCYHTIQWRHDERDGVSNHRRIDCLHNRFFFQTQIKENINAPRHCPLWGEFTADRWIPRTKGQLRGKWFHLMMSSWKLKSFFFCSNALCLNATEGHPDSVQVLQMDSYMVNKCTYLMTSSNEQFYKMGLQFFFSIIIKWLIWWTSMISISIRKYMHV